MTWAYNNIFVISQAVMLFLLFRNISIKQSAIINSFASCAFGVFLIHTDQTLGVLIYDNLFHTRDLVDGNSFVLLSAFLLCLPVMYVYCFILEYFKQLFFDPLKEKFLKRCLGCFAKITIE